MKPLRSLISLAVALQVFSVQSLACGRFVPLDADGLPVIDNEMSLIVWDAEKGIEHFIRQVKFDKAPADFAFVIPVPSVPDFAEAPAKIFTWVRKELPDDGALEGALGGSSRSSKGGPEAVEILKSQDVAGLNATVVRSESPAALQKWLEKNKYAVPKEAASWIKHYVDLKWNFVALKIKPTNGKTKTSSKKAVASPVLRISFKTPKPFFPYREFDSRKAEPGREFSLYLIAPSVLSGHYESRKVWESTASSKALSHSLKAKVKKDGSYDFDVSELEQYLDKLLGPRKGSQDLYISHFVNREARRPYAEDLYFDSK